MVSAKTIPYLTEFSLIPKATVMQPKTSIEYVTPNQNDAFFFRMLEANGLVLNKQQVDIVRSNSGPVLINSIPGSGKSTVITCKIGYLLSVEHVKPESILAITFTRKAALSLNAKLQELNIPGCGNVLGCTFHAICLRIIKLSGIKDFKLLTSDTYKTSIIKHILRDLSWRTPIHRKKY